MDEKFPFTPVDSQRRVIDRLALVPRAYSQFSHTVLIVITKNSRDHLWYERVAYATKPEFQARNIQHHPLLLWPDCDILE